MAASSVASKTITLRGGLVMPVLGLGTWQAPAAEVRKAVVAAIGAGYRAIDTAAVYGNEAAVGEGIRDSSIAREELFVTTKLWSSEFAKGDVEAAVRASVERLGVGPVDLLLMHWPFRLKKGAGFPPEAEDRLGYSREMALETWAEMLRCRDELGLTKAVGVSNFTVKKLRDLLEGVGDDESRWPAMNQVESHPALPSDALLGFCKGKGIAMTAYSPLGSPGRPDRLKKEGNPVPMEEEAVVAAAAAHGVTPAQILIRWAVQRGTCVIPKSVNEGRIAANADVFGFELSDAEMESIKAIDKGPAAGRIIDGGLFMKEGDTVESMFDGE